MRYVLSTLATLALGATPLWACNPIPVVPGNGLLQQLSLMQSYMQSYSAVGATPALATVPPAGCGYGTVGASFAPSFAPASYRSYGTVGASFAPAFVPAFAPASYTPGVVVPGAAGPAHGRFRIRGRF